MKHLWLFLSCVLILLSSIMDNARGPLLPHLTEILELSYRTSSLFFVVANFSAVITGAIFIFLSQKLPIKKLLYLTCGLATITAFFTLQTHSTTTLLFLGTLIGISVNALNTLANICAVGAVPPKERGRTASIVNMFYGIGAFTGPLWVGFILANQKPWSFVYWPLGFLFASIAIGLFFFSKLNPNSASAPSLSFATDKPQKINRAQMRFLLIINLYVLSEILACVWMSTYLVDVYHQTAEYAAWINAGFFITFTLSRLLTSVFLTPQNENTFLAIALTGGCLTLLLGMYTHPLFFMASGMIGLIFPTLYGQMTRHWEHQMTQLSFILFTLMQIGLGAAHFAIGQLVEIFGIAHAYILPTFSMALMTVLYFISHKPQSTTKAIAFPTQAE